MTVTEQTLIEYQEKFKSVLPHWRVTSEAKTWYKNKYRFRLELGDPHGSIRNFSYTHASPLRKKVLELDPTARVRKEGCLRVFTNETSLLDAFLDDPEMLGHVYGLTTSNIQYVDELDKLDNIAVDVKLISAIKYDPDIKYQIDFHTYWGWRVGGRSTQKDNLLELYNFIKSDKTIDFLPEDTFINIPIDAFICDSCKCNIIETDNQCDFCDKKMCEECQSSSYYHFIKCEECGVKYCYYDGLNSDYRCLKIRGGSNCENCGV